MFFKTLPDIPLLVLFFVYFATACSSKYGVIKTQEVEPGIQKVIPLENQFNGKKQFRKFDNECHEWLEVIKNPATGQWEHTVKAQRRKMALLLEISNMTKIYQHDRPKDEYRPNLSSLIHPYSLWHSNLSKDYLREQKQRLDWELTCKQMPYRPSQLLNNLPKKSAGSFFDTKSKIIVQPTDDSAYQVQLDATPKSGAKVRLRTKTEAKTKLTTKTTEPAVALQPKKRQQCTHKQNVEQK
ncbi:hypothetical protein DSUL_150069 [Desulfovibrionales bacterium]